MPPPPAHRATDDFSAQPASIDGPWYLTHWGLLTPESDRAFSWQGRYGPHRGRCRDPSDTPTYSARTFLDAFELFPLTVGAEHLYERQDDGTLKAIWPLYFVVEGIRVVARSAVKAEAIHKSGGNYLAGIYVTDSLRDAGYYIREWRNIL
ncbi:hypothetical protein B0H10DRAFT_2208932 [Mycena sp. CBHHK59/15]|nr:hypothetical protein B0H10DRAFT_2208932 [Mycena sp. CBHHK59/15]